MTEAPLGAPRRRARWISIRWVASALAVLLTAGAVFAMGAVSERNAHRALKQEIERRLELQARNLAGSSTSALLGDYPELVLHPLIKEMRGQEPELELAVVVDHDNRIQGHSDARALGTSFVPPAGLGATTELAPQSRAEFLRPAGGLLVARSPVLHANGQVIGAVYVGLPLKHIDAVVQSTRRQQALLLGVWMLVAAGAAFFLMSQLLRPIGALRAGLERIGRGDLDTPLRVGDRTELALLAETVNDMASALKRAQAEMLERERLTHEIELARDIQRSLLPSRERTAGPFDIRGDQRAAAEVGGDYWDVLALPNGCVGLAVADVAGKGLAGCLVMSMLSALLRTLRTVHSSPAALLGALDERLSETLRPGVFVTMWYGVLDPASGRLTFASAGHNPLVLWRRATGRVETRTSRGIPIGAIRGGAIRATLRDETVQLAPGDVFLQFTDGYSEAFENGHGEQFGLERIEESVRQHATSGGEAVLAALERGIRAWSGDATPADDETLLVVTCDPHAPAFVRSANAETADETELRLAIERLSQAERLGHGLELSARLDRLGVLDGWMRALPGIASLSADRLEVARLALYEACANIIEHGYDEDGRGRIEVWWNPGSPAGGEGWFVIRDDGRPYRPFARRTPNFEDPAVRARGRGLGLEIIHRAAARVSYQPATPRGNITVLVIGFPGQESSKEEIAA
ncbi:MAG: ATP-binding SpoIIE family protein phosphatase [Candidatus Eiseniibacteriota bacterium]